MVGTRLPVDALGLAVGWSNLESLKTCKPARLEGPVSPQT
jgi:hypothetical protein